VDLWCKEEQGHGAKSKLLKTPQKSILFHGQLDKSEKGTIVKMV